MKVVVRRRALRQTERIGFYIAERRPAAAVEFAAEFAALTERLGYHPFSSPAIREKHLRQATMTGFPYVVIYRVRRDRVTVLGVFHAARHPSVRRS